MWGWEDGQAMEVVVFQVAEERFDAKGNVYGDVLFDDSIYVNKFLERQNTGLSLSSVATIMLGERFRFGGDMDGLGSAESIEGEYSCILHFVGESGIERTFE